MTVTNVWTTGPGDRQRAALRAARRLGYRNPAVARVVEVRGAHGEWTGVLVAEGKAEAEQHRRAGRRRKGAVQ